MFQILSTNQTLYLINKERGSSIVTWRRRQINTIPSTEGQTVQFPAHPSQWKAELRRTWEASEKWPLY